MLEVNIDFDSSGRSNIIDRPISLVGAAPMRMLGDFNKPANELRALIAWKVAWINQRMADCLP